MYPGMKLHFPMVALDVFNQVTFAEISMLLLTNSSSQDNNATYQTLNKNWYIDSPLQIIPQDNCTLLSITLLKHIYDEHDESALPLRIATTQSDVYTVNYLIPKKCPVGFQFYDSSHKCACSPVFHYFNYQPVCKITSDGYNPLITINLPVTTVTLDWNHEQPECKFIWCIN